MTYPILQESQEIRSGAAGALLARHLARCVWYHANDESLPEIDMGSFDSPDDVETVFGVVAAMLGIKPDCRRGLNRVVDVMTAMAELIADQGAALECDLARLVRNERREAMVFKLVPRGDDGELAVEGLPPCSRHQGGENDSRVLATLASAILRANTPELEDALMTRIARAHDHKGTLYIAYHQPLGEAGLFLRRAWHAVAGESEQDVVFCDVNGDEWHRVWGERNFESRWKPAA